MPLCSFLFAKYAPRAFFLVVFQTLWGPLAYESQFPERNGRELGTTEQANPVKCKFIIFKFCYFQPTALCPRHPLTGPQQSPASLTRAISPGHISHSESRISKVKENWTCLGRSFNSFPICEAQDMPLGLIPDDVVSSISKAAWIPLDTL